MLQATREPPIKNDFVKTCESYLKQLNMNMTFEELSKMSKWSVKELVKSKTHEAAFSYLLTEKNKQTKISHIQYSALRMQEYLLEGNTNTEMSKLIYKARGMCLDLKTHKKWKYKNDICVRCEQHSETVTYSYIAVDMENGNMTKKLRTCNIIYSFMVQVVRCTYWQKLYQGG